MYMRYGIYCYADENGDNLVKVEGANTEAEACERADELFDNYERVEIIDKKTGEKVY